MSVFSKQDYDLINLGVCIKQQAERLGIEHDGVPLEGVVVRIAERARSVVAEEPEWEYGVRLHPDVEFEPNENRATYTPPTTPHPSLERAQEMAKLNPRYRATYHRRRKAGPWVPVKQEGTGE